MLHSLESAPGSYGTTGTFFNFIRDVAEMQVPSQSIPGDSFCYFTGMAFSAVAIQGHFSKTLILFFIPQILNFILFCPQLFHLVHCPRHRLPA